MVTKNYIALAALFIGFNAFAMQNHHPVEEFRKQVQNRFFYQYNLQLENDPMMRNQYNAALKEASQWVESFRRNLDNDVKMALDYLVQAEAWVFKASLKKGAHEELAQAVQLAEAQYELAKASYNLIYTLPQ